MYIKKKESLSESENSLDLNNLILKEEELNSGNRSNKCINYKEENERKIFIKLERRNISLEKKNIFLMIQKILITIKMQIIF
jgi:hypothetical protein